MFFPPLFHPTFGVLLSEAFRTSSEVIMRLWRTWQVERKPGFCDFGPLKKGDSGVCLFDGSIPLVAQYCIPTCIWMREHGSSLSQQRLQFLVGLFNTDFVQSSLLVLQGTAVCIWHKLSLTAVHFLRCQRVSHELSLKVYDERKLSFRQWKTVLFTSVGSWWKYLFGVCTCSLLEMPESCSRML